MENPFFRKDVIVIFSAQEPLDVSLHLLLNTLHEWKT